MSTALDIRLIPRVYALIQKYGKTVIFYTGTWTYNAATSTGTFTGGSSYSVKVTPPAAPNPRQQMIEGDIILAEDVEIFLAAQNLPFTPSKLMRVAIDGESWQIIHIQPIYTGDDIALYQIQLRR